MPSILFVFILLVIGVLLRVLADLHARNVHLKEWLLFVPDNLSKGLTAFALWVSLPALILVRIPILEVSGDLAVLIIMPWVMLGISAVLVLLVSRFFKWGLRIEGMLLLLVPLGNTSFLGIPMVEAYFGEGYTQYVLLYDQAGTYLALATYGAFIAAYYPIKIAKGEEARASIDSAAAKSSLEGSPVDSGGRRGAFVFTVLLKVACFPPFVALVVALATSGLVYPQALILMLERLGDTLIPIVIVAVGLNVIQAIPSTDRAPLATGLILKLIVAPLIALGGCYVIGLNSDMAKVSIFEAGMPAQVAAWVVASEAGLADKLGAALVGLGIVLSLGTLPALFALIELIL